MHLRYNFGKRMNDDKFTRAPYHLTDQSNLSQFGAPPFMKCETNRTEQKDSSGHSQKIWNSPKMFAYMENTSGSTTSTPSTPLPISIFSQNQIRCTCFRMKKDMMHKSSGEVISQQNSEHLRLSEHDSLRVTYLKIKSN